MLLSVLEAYGLKVDTLKIKTFGSGLINHTWKVSANGNMYILQKINNQVFKQPQAIAGNIDLIAAYLQLHYPEYNFTSPVLTIDGKSMVIYNNEGFFRLFDFVEGSSSKDVVETAAQAYEAATQFGRFTKLLSGLDIDQLKVTIPDFHNLTLRYNQFSTSLTEGNTERIAAARWQIKKIVEYDYIVKQYQDLVKNPALKLRATHHDTKISNILFNKLGEGLCVIDLDTVMPGYFISDVGDMMRTYLSPMSEEETNFSKIEIRDEFYEAVVLGYYNEMKDELTETETQHFFYAGTFMIYMQAIRFLTDYINDDTYYGAKYPAHNLLRAHNQIVLLQRLLEKKPVLENLLNIKSR